MNIVFPSSLTKEQVERKLGKIRGAFPVSKIVPTQEGYKVKFLSEEQERRLQAILDEKEDAVDNTPNTPDFTYMIKNYVENIVNFHVAAVKERVEGSFAKLSEAEKALKDLQSSFEAKVALAEASVDQKMASKVGELNTRVDAGNVEIETLRKIISDTVTQIRHSYEETNQEMVNLANHFDEKIIELSQEIEKQVLEKLHAQVAIELMAMKDEKTNVFQQLKTESDKLNSYVQKVIDHLASIPKG